jgi:flagellar hook-length control protein FliK
MSPFGLLPGQPPGVAPTGNSLSRTPAGAAYALPEGLLQLAGIEDLTLLAESGAWSPEFLAMLQQLLPPGTPLPAAGMKLPDAVGAFAAPAADGPEAGGRGDAEPGSAQALLARLQAVAPRSELPPLLSAAQGEAPGAAAGTLVTGLANQGFGQLVAATASVELGGGSPGTPAGVLPVAAAAAPAGTSGAAPTAMLALPQRVGEPGWQQALGERVLWLAGREQQVAELRLNPPHLGPLEVRVVVQQDQASVVFLSQHAAVREALEQAVPRLRDMLGQQDLQLVQVDVGERHTPQQQADREGHGQLGHRAQPGAVEPTAGPAAPDGLGVRSGHGLVDLFA